MYASQISSNVLYHFTKSRENLLSILRNGFWPMTAIEDISFMLPKQDGAAEVGIPMVCFTDIPLDLSQEHRKQYGLFGIGLSKQWGMEKGLNPVSYMAKNSKCYGAFNRLQFLAQKNALELDKINKNEDKILEILSAVMNYAGFIKIYCSDATLETKPFKDEGVGIDGFCN